MHVLESAFYGHTAEVMSVCGGFILQDDGFWSVQRFFKSPLATQRRSKMILAFLLLFFKL